MANLFGTALDYLFGGPKVGGADEHRLNVWCNTPGDDLALPHARTRYVVLDTETTGLDLRRDRVIAIGAAALNGGWLDLSDCFEVVLRQDTASADANILFHGIGGATQLAGSDPKKGMLDFLEYVRKSPLVAFRVEFDGSMLDRTMRSILGLPLQQPWIDLAFLLPALFPDTECRSLDDWLAYFGLASAKRHQALGDAFASAQMLQIALEEARRQRMENAAQLIAVQKAQRWLGKRS